MKTCQQAIRDLDWVLTSPTLISPSHVAEEISDSIEPTNLNQFQNELAEFIHRESPRRDQYRVGRYFEQLVLFYLKHIRQVEIVASGLQIRDGSRTVGELDFVFRDEQGRLQHWETAVKFYLFHPDPTESGNHLVGPDSRDNFEKKMQRLFEHQLPLSNKPFPDIAERHAFVKGRVFYHPEFLPPTSLPDLLSPDHLRGVWLYRRDLDWLSRLAESSGSGMARIVQKPLWLSPDIVTDTPSDLTAKQLVPVENLQAQLKQHFRESSSPRLVSLLARQSGEWREVERVFVVAESWPNDR
ncbi:MAG: DUF1853 family protein [Planctomycetota bacterium]|nr:DUF1853 family protein [Planctomycetota bacterium]